MRATTKPVEHSNEVRLIGRLSVEPEAVMLPSGDEIVTTRLVVQRPRPPAGVPAPRRVDTVTCTAWGPAQRRSLRVLDQGDTVEITGALRRRFWRSGAGPGQSTFEIEIETASLLIREPPPTPKKRAAKAPVAAAPPQPEPPPERRLVLIGGEVAHQ
ncbi:single-stranded DNA-binding protein [Jiangella endophytica]|uniref:single-stranded DNA-binding protein n=1 Tax=Jiangella endophytica TaxID=1623398 RepID=UPI000E351F21|nr:single-stranded DNA-binding protein [Jiangella endophytica]